MKRIFALLLAVLLAASAPLLLAGCSGKGSGNSESDGAYTFRHLSIVLPEGFFVDESASMPIAYPPGATEETKVETDNITFAGGDGDSIDNYTEEMMVEYYASSLDGFEKFSVFEKTKLDGYDLLIMSFTLTRDDQSLTQTQYDVMGEDFSEVITFTSFSGKYDEAFKTAAASIHVVSSEPEN